MSMSSKSKSKKSKNKAPSAKSKRNAPYPYADFVTHWKGSNSIKEVVEKTGLKRFTVAAMATKLRKQGVKLKTMPRRLARPIDVKALNKILGDD